MSFSRGQPWLQLWACVVLREQARAALAVAQLFLNSEEAAITVYSTRKQEGTGNPGSPSWRATGRCHHPPRRPRPTYLSLPNVFLLFGADPSGEGVRAVCIIHAPSSGNRWENPPRKIPAGALRGTTDTVQCFTFGMALTDRYASYKSQMTFVTSELS